MKLYKTTDKLTLPGICNNQPLYKDKDKKLYFYTDKTAYPIIINEEHATSFSVKGKTTGNYYTPQGSDISLGKCIYQIEISNMTWDEKTKSEKQSSWEEIYRLSKNQGKLDEAINELEDKISTLDGHITQLYLKIESTKEEGDAF